MDALHILSAFSLVVVLLVALGFYFRVLRPLRHLASRAAKLASGDLNAFRQPIGGIADIGALRRAMAAMAEHVRRVEQGRHAYVDAFTGAQEAERARISRELHDDTVQSLIAIAHNLELASTWIENDTPRATTLMQETRVQALEAAAGLRRLIGDLRPPALEELGLVPALRMLSGSLPGAALTVEIVEGAERRLDPAHELTLFRAAQEAVRNAQRHSHARHIRIQIAYMPASTRLTVQDDGIGFSMPEQIEQLVAQRRFGLIGMSERVEHLGGTVRIHSTPGSGTRVDIELPLKATAQPPGAVRDPVCSALIQPQQAYGSVEYAGKRYYFCCPVCQGAFQRNPDAYVSQ